VRWRSAPRRVDDRREGELHLRDPAALPAALGEGDGSPETGSYNQALSSLYGTRNCAFNGQTGRGWFLEPALCEPVRGGDGR
jgi:hypothetical protein